MYHSQTLPEMRLLNVGYASNNADWNFENVNSPFSRIYYVVEGHARLRIGRTVYDLRQGNIYLIPAFTMHSCECDGRFCHYYIHFYEDHMSGNSVMTELDMPVELAATEKEKTLFETMCDHNKDFALTHINPQDYDNESQLIERIRLCRKFPLYLRLESVGIIYQILSEFMLNARMRYSVSDPRLLRVKEYISHNISTPPRIEYQQISKRSTYLSRSFLKIVRQRIRHNSSSVYHSGTHDEGKDASCNRRYAYCRSI